ncbi:MAG: MutS family DNA mismatch repair protein, partial [Fulvivirga sp.]|nr:MutS family DNA mismatch repair protein [Fulvivirga sp.]
KAGLHEIRARQAATKEMIDQIDWRQEFQAAGMDQEIESERFQGFVDWVNDPYDSQVSGVTKVISYLLPLSLITLLILGILGIINFLPAIGVAMITGFLLKKYVKKVNNITEKSNEGLATLDACSSLILLIENHQFKSPFLKQLKKTFQHDKLVASASIKKLHAILYLINSRSNLFYAIFNLLLFLDIHLLVKIAHWKKKHREEVVRWFDAIASMEAINSMAGYAYANTTYTFPEVVKAGYILSAENIGHPLIKPDERINNHFKMEGKGSIALITGSNMSGKSTFLRTLGTNAVLAYMGAPVCANQMQISIMQLFSSMRTEDNLEEHISSFYAELKRIKQLLQLLKKEEPVLFMLDEILKGTNSQDRHAGAEALVRQLAKENVMGFVSTHDLELGKLADELPEVINYSFNSEIKNDKIIFDYKLTRGLCHSFNASKLMEQIGIDLHS